MPWCWDCGQINHTKDQCLSEMKDTGSFLPSKLRNPNFRQIPMARTPLTDKRMLYEALDEILKNFQVLRPWEQGKDGAPATCAYCGQTGHHAGPCCSALNAEIESRRPTPANKQQPATQTFARPLPVYAQNPTRQSVPVNLVQVENAHQPMPNTVTVDGHSYTLLRGENTTSDISMESSTLTSGTHPLN